VSKPTYVAACDPEILVSNEEPLRHVTIRVQLVEKGPEDRPQRSGKYIHLALSVRDAMLIQAALQQVQIDRKIEIRGQPSKIVVPPAKDRH